MVHPIHTAMRVGLGLFAACLLSATAFAVTVSYTADLNTSNGQPVTDLLILETDGVQTSIDYAFTLPGTGRSVLTHDVPFTPTQSLVVGVTEGVEKTQIVMFLNNDFAAANAGINFSQAFPNTRHSELITRLTAAVAGDANELAWFTDVFFPGDGAAAAFDPFDSFTVAEFTGLTIIGDSQTAGNWMVDSITDTPQNNAATGEARLPRSAVVETATDGGPFDMRFELVDLSQVNPRPGTAAIDLTVTNDSGQRMTGFELILGKGLGENFVPSDATDQLRFSDLFQDRDLTGHFAGTIFEEDRIVFSGDLADGETAQFLAFVDAFAIEDTHFTIRQIAILVPEPGTLVMAGLLVGLGVMWRRLFFADLMYLCT